MDEETRLLTKYEEKIRVLNTPKDSPVQNSWLRTWFCMTILSGVFLYVSSGASA